MRLKRLHVLEADVIKIKKKHWFDVSSQWIHFLHEILKISGIAFVSEIDNFHMNGLHLFWNTLSLSLPIYIYIYIYINTSFIKRFLVKKKKVLNTNQKTRINLKINKISPTPPWQSHYWQIHVLRNIVITRVLRRERTKKRTNNSCFSKNEKMLTIEVYLMLKNSMGNI